MKYDNLINKLKVSDQEISAAYEDINATTFNGNSLKSKVYVKMKGNFELEDLSLPKDIDSERLKDGLIEAINDAVKRIKKDRKEVVKKILNKDWSEFD